MGKWVWLTIVWAVFLPIVSGKIPFHPLQTCIVAELHLVTLLMTQLP